MNYKIVNNIKLYAPTSRNDLISYAFDNKSLLVAVNAEKILHATDDSRDIINKNVGYPDGFGAVLALEKSGVSNVSKIPGCELWLSIIDKHYLSKKFYLVGSTDKVINKTVEKLRAEYKGINILNFRDGYLKNESEVDELIKDISEKKPDVVFVAMGSPKQEFIMEKIRAKHPAVYQGLGGSFDVYVGKVRRAPDWWVKYNLEWLYRLLQEPTRIKRQIYLLKFLIFLYLGKFK